MPFGKVASGEPTGAVFSPDGRWVAYHVELFDGGITGGVFVQPFPATGAVYQAPRVNRDFHQLWARG